MSTLRAIRNTARAAVGTPTFLVQHGLRLRKLERTSSNVLRFSEPPPTPELVGIYQSSDDGCGPFVSRGYVVQIESAEIGASELIDAFASRPNDFAPHHLAGFFVDDRPATDLTPGDEVVVELPGPWNGLVRIVERGSTHVLMATLDGHMEAGFIRFRAIDTADGGVRFEIRSWARAGDKFFEQLHVVVGLAREAQTAMWVHTCDCAVTVSEGRRSSPIIVTTETLENSELAC